VVPVIIGDSRLAIVLSQALYEQGILALPIVHPAVSPRNARLRFFLTSQHTTDQIGFTVECLAKLVKSETTVPSDS
jgi:8-amino-7-oxononanoate synthase